MNEIVMPVLAGVAGLLLGALFFGGLWWTVNRGVASPYPALWFVGSLLVRMGVTLAGFYTVSGGRWERLVPCLLGFFAARFVVTWMTRPARADHNPSEREAGHATESR